MPPSRIPDNDPNESPPEIEEVPQGIYLEWKGFRFTASTPFVIALISAITLAAIAIMIIVELHYHRYRYPP